MTICAGQTAIEDLIRTAPPVTEGLRFLADRGRKKQTGTTCLLPECSANVYRSTGGRQSFFDKEECRDVFAARRAALLAALASRQRLLGSGRLMSAAERQTERDCAYLRKVLLGYPDPDTA